jgi:hypothetical protein
MTNIWYAWHVVEFGDQFSVTVFTLITILLSFSFNRASLKSKALIVIADLIRIFDNCEKFSKNQLLKTVFLNYVSYFIWMVDMFHFSLIKVFLLSLLCLQWAIAWHNVKVNLLACDLKVAVLSLEISKQLHVKR